MENIADIFAIDPGAKVKTYKKGEIIQHKGKEKPWAFYVKAGLLKSYILDSKAKQHIFQFAPEGWIVADIESLEFDRPAELFIECIEDSEVVLFDRKKLLDGELPTNQISRNFKLLYRRMGTLQRRIIMQMSSPAMDRYEYFLETYPNLLNRVPQHMIASYLGITPQALSTLRSKIAQKT